MLVSLHGAGWRVDGKSMVPGFTKPGMCRQRLLHALLWSCCGALVLRAMSTACSWPHGGGTSRRRWSAIHSRVSQQVQEQGSQLLPPPHAHTSSGLCQVSLPSAWLSLQACHCRTCAVYTAVWWKGKGRACAASEGRRGKMGLKSRASWGREAGQATGHRANEAAQKGGPATPASLPSVCPRAATRGWLTRMAGDAVPGCSTHLG